MQFADELECELRDIEKTRLWSVYREAIDKALKGVKNDLCNAKPEDVARLQGRAFAYKMVLALPDKIVEDSKASTPGGAANGVKS